MHLKPTSPSGVPPASPPKHTLSLPGIPEARSGPNAFAQQAARMERHRLDGNAFYQQEVHRRRFTPPTNVHPALRPGVDLDMSSLLHVMPPPATRESTVTTMSSFINAGGQHYPSPPLNLVPVDQHFAEPTQRGIIEERREQVVHDASGSDEERTPVYQTYAPTPKPLSSEFSHSKPNARPSTPRKTRASLPRKDSTTAAGESHVPKSPKKTFFEKLRITKFAGSTPSPSMSTLTSAEDFLPEEAGMPVKAQAVLGASPSKGYLVRSPSKQRGLFSSVSGRRGIEGSSINTTAASPTRKSALTASQDPPHTASSITKTPQTAVSDRTHYSYITAKHVPSQTLSDRGAYSVHSAPQCAIQRSQSLKYFDAGVPPTPPAKNTPPDAKAAKEAATNRLYGLGLHQVDGTPSKSPLGMVSVSDRLSPTKLGTYAHKETPRLVTKPSLYSLHASVVPEVMEATTFEEMKARIDGLGLDGFNMPEETQYHHSPEMMYTPSICSTDWGVRPSMMTRTPRSGHHRFSLDELPTVAETPGEGPSSGHRTKQSSSSGGTIPVCYPALAEDPSLPNLITTQQPPVKGHVRSHTSPNLDRLRAISAHYDQDELPLHGRTHSRDHSNSPTHSTNTNIFALPAEDANNPSPASFRHPSAMPSPLHYLPATVYTPPPKVSRKRLDVATPVPTRESDVEKARESTLGMHGQRLSANDSPTHSKSMLDNVPTLTAHPPLRGTISPRTSRAASPEHENENVDPQKPGQSDTHASKDKMDQVLAMLGNIQTHNTDISAMREEMRAANARLDARLAHVEGFQRSTPSPNSSVMGFDGASSQQEESSLGVGRNQHRISTGDARDFYRFGQSSDPHAVLSSPPTSVDGGSTRADTEGEEDKLEKLAAKNRQLTEIVQGFAAQLEEMKKSMHGRT